MSTIETDHPVVVRNGMIINEWPDALALHGLQDFGATKVETDPETGKLTRLPTSFLSGSSDGYSYPLPNFGLSQLVKSHLGTTIYSHRRIQTLGAPEVVDRCTYADLPGFLASNESGQIRFFGGSKSIADVFRDIRLSFPTIRMAVIGSKVKNLKKLYSQVRELCHGQTDSYWNHEFVGPCTLIRNHSVVDGDAIAELAFATYFGTSELELSHFDLVLVLDALNASHQRLETVLAQPDASFRLFGLVDGGWLSRASDFDKGKLFTTFGPSTFDVMPYGRARRATSLAMVRADSGSDGSPRYASCFRRNKLISKIALGIAGDVSSLQKHRDLKFLARESCFVGGSPSVTVLVDRVAHALALKKLLLDWPVYGEVGEEALSRVPGSVRNAIRRETRLWKDGQKQIVIYDHNSPTGFRGRISDVIIWAGGGERPLIPSSWCFGTATDRKPLLIVDLFDQEHWRTRPRNSKCASRREHSKHRFDYYREHGAVRPGTSLVDERCKFFIAKYGKRIHDN